MDYKDLEFVVQSLSYPQIPWRLCLSRVWSPVPYQEASVRRAVVFLEPGTISTSITSSSFISSSLVTIVKINNIYMQTITKTRKSDVRNPPSRDVSENAALFRDVVCAVVPSLLAMFLWPGAVEIHLADDECE